MKAIRIHAFGGSAVLTRESLELAKPAAHEVRVQHTAIGVNFIDTYQRSGLYPLPLPLTLGQEAAGVVAEVGSDVLDFAVGDRVAYCTTGPGAYCEARNVAANHLIKLPDHVSDEHAAASLLKGMTVEYLIRRCFAVQAGQTVLFHAVAGGVGQIALQWLKQLNVTVIGTVGSPAKAELARQLGCDHVINYNTEDFVAGVREITGAAGVPVVYDSVGKTTLPGSLACVQRRGTLVSFGNASGKPDPIDPLQLLAQGSVYLTRPKLGDYCVSRAELEACAQAFFDAMNNGLQIQISQRYALADAAAAHQALEARRTTGSVILLP
jgi:NADPH2:quinone reductase